jgi:flagellar biogenesis protein FliO
VSEETARKRAVTASISDLTGRGNLKKQTLCAACAAWAFACALAVQPLAAQTKLATGSNGTQSSAAAGATSSSTTAATPARTPLDESQIPLGTTANAATGQVQPAASSGVTAWDYLRMLLILACVVVAIYLLFWLLRRGAGKKIQDNDLIHVLGSRGLSGSRALHLVEVGSSVYLVGSSDGGVDLIAEITEKESLDSLRLKAAEQAPAGRRTFQHILSEIFRPAKKSFSVGEGIGLLRGQRERLKKL